MDTVLNAAFIGCGAIAQKAFAVVKRNERIHIAAVFDMDFNRAEQCQKEFGNADTKTAKDIEEIMTRDDIDIIFVSTPNHTHAEYSIQGLKNKKHVICEKPMALNAKEAEAMATASVDNSRLLHISYQNRYTNQAIYVKRLMQDGFFKDIYYAKAYALRRRAVPTWGTTTQRKYQGGGCLIDIGSHAIDLALWEADNFEPLYVVGTTYDRIAKQGSEANYWGNWDIEKNDVEDCALGFVVMKNGMTLSVESSYALNIVKEMEASVDLFGVAGGAQIREGESVKLVHEAGERMCITENEMQESVRSLTPRGRNDSPSKREHDSVINKILEGGKDDSAKQALTVARIVEGIYQSAETKQPVYF